MDHILDIEKEDQDFINDHRKVIENHLMNYVNDVEIDKP